MFRDVLPGPIANYFTREGFWFADEGIQHACFTGPKASYIGDEPVIVNK